MGQDQTRKRLSTKSSSQIVVVNSSATPVGDPKEDEELKKMKEIPRFFPILKGVLPAFKDSPEILTKIEPKYIYRFLHRLQFHFSVCSRTVSSEQSSISTQIVEVDQLIGNLSKKMTQTTKKYDYFTAEMKKAELLNQQLDSLQLLFQEIIPGLIFLNEILPDAERLPTLQLPTPQQI
uniref:BLOC-1-related complex subunit 5 n=1 Tax=Ditylenchus dipsaci TaxID=166011 RepID=A0A915CLL6_9BILA